MKNFKITSLLMLLLFLGVAISCSEDNWEDYTPPEQNLPAEEEEPEEEEEDNEEPEEDDEDDEEEEEQEQEDIVLRVMSFGIYNKNADLEQVAALIADYDPDLIVLREIDSKNTRTGIEIEQGQVVADLLDMNYYFASGWSYREGEYGPSMLSKFPITSPQSTVLPVGPVLEGQERPFAWATIEVEENLDIIFGAAHLDDGSNANRRAENLPLQAQELLDIFSSVDEPVILGGNFYFQTANEPPVNILYDEFTPGCTECELTFPGDSPEFVADHIMFRENDQVQMEFTSYEVGPENINNRKPVISEIRIVVGE